MNDVDSSLQVAISASLASAVLSKFPLFVPPCVIRSMTLLNSVISLCEFHGSASECRVAFGATGDDENEVDN